MLSSVLRTKSADIIEPQLSKEDAENNEGATTTMGVDQDEEYDNAYNEYTTNRSVKTIICNS